RRAARRATRRRAEHGAEDHRLPDEARGLPLCRRVGRSSRDRAGEARRAARARRSLTRQHWLVAGLCAGIAWANAVRAPSALLLVVAGAAALGAFASERGLLFVVALALAGW